MVASEELVQNAQKVAERDPIFGQILILYEKHVHGEQDNNLANFVLTSIRDDMREKLDDYYMKRLLGDAGITRKRWERMMDTASRRVIKLEDQGIEIDEQNNFVAQMSELSGLSDFEVEEILDVEDTIPEMTGEVASAIVSPSFNVKLEALDRAMHNFHAGIAPMEMFDVTREEIEDFAEFLKRASGSQLASLTRQMDKTPKERNVTLVPSSRVPSPIEGHMPSGRPIRFGDRRPRPVRVRPYRRRRPHPVRSIKARVRHHLRHPPKSCLCHRSKTVDRVRRGLVRRLK